MLSLRVIKVTGREKKTFSMRLDVGSQFRACYHQNKQLWTVLICYFILVNVNSYRNIVKNWSHACDHPSFRIWIEWLLPIWAYRYFALNFKKLKLSWTQFLIQYSKTIKSDCLHKWTRIALIIPCHVCLWKIYAQKCLKCPFSSCAMFEKV